MRKVCVCLFLQTFSLGESFSPRESNIDIKKVGTQKTEDRTQKLRNPTGIPQDNTEGVIFSATRRSRSDK